MLIGPYELVLDLKHWVNDGLMALFFFVGRSGGQAGAHHRRADRSHAGPPVPLVAAVAGLAVARRPLPGRSTPDGEAARAWGVVVSTDTAFVLGAARARRARCPAPGSGCSSLTLAVADDIGALTIIGFFYTERLVWGWLGLGLVGLAPDRPVALAPGPAGQRLPGRRRADLDRGLRVGGARDAGGRGDRADPAGLPTEAGSGRSGTEAVTRAFRQSPSAESERLARRQIQLAPWP